MRSRVAVALLLGLAAPAAAQPPGMSPGYEAVVRRYAQGDRDGALAAAARLSERELRDELEALRRLARWARACGVCLATLTWRRAPVPAALMLHTDCSRQGPRDHAASRLHESVAIALAELLAGGSERGGFALRWYAVMAGLAAKASRFEDGLGWAERGLKLFPHSPELLLARGAIEESMASVGSPRLAEILGPSARETQLSLERYRAVRSRLESAREALRAAVAADPAPAEGWLRLGRVEWRLGDPKQARAAFEQSLSRTPARGTACLAQLFVGRLDEDAGHFGDAAGRYESALALVADGQAARIALSHVRLRLGDAAAARRELEAAVAAAGRRSQVDPFWNYPWGPAVGVEDRLEALRREAAS